MSKAGREQRLAALAIKKMAIVCSTNNRFENAAIFSGKRLTTLSKSEAHALLNLEHRWLIFTFVLVQGEGVKRLHHISIKSSPCKSDDLQEHTKEAHNELLRSHKNNVISSGFIATLREDIEDSELMRMVEITEQLIEASSMAQNNQHSCSAVAIIN